jgi:M-phase inducer tyrosine phosphatase
MDISPLPHKQTYFSQIEVQSPTPKSTPDEEVEMQSSPPRPVFVEAPRPTNGVE